MTKENTLSPREQYMLTALSSSADAKTAQRAQVLLQWAAHEPREQIAQSSGMPLPRIKRWIRAFMQKRLEVFSSASVERAGRGLAGRTSVSALLQQHNVDMDHARHVATLALQIFSETRALHGLAPDCRNLLEIAAWLHNVGMTRDEQQHHRAGRDIILAHELENLSEQDRDVLACLTLFHRKAVKPARDPIFASLDDETQRTTLKLAAILRVADGLDYSQSQTTRIGSIQIDGLVDVVVAGPHAAEDAERANNKADLWRQVLSPPFHARLEAESSATGEVDSVRKQKTKDEEGLQPHEPITRAGQRIIQAQFEQLRSLEDAVQQGTDVEAIHDMRVAARRLRSAFRLLRPYYSKKQLKGIRGPLRELAEHLGQVRDLDVAIGNLQNYAGTLAAERQRALEPLLNDWQAQREQARHDLREFLDGATYQTFVKRMNRFLEATSGRSAPPVYLEVPILIWQHYGDVRDFSERVELRSQEVPLPVLHALRIQCKRLRYVLEFFAEVLGSHVPVLRQPLVALQDHLGELHDADVASRMVVSFIAEQMNRAEHPIGTTSMQELTTYLSTIQARVVELQSSFRERWQLIIDSSFYQTLAEAVAVL